MKSEKNEFYNELAKIVGKEYVSTDLEDLVPYGRDIISQAFKTYTADGVVMPGTVEEVQSIVRLANRYKVPLYPYVYGSNIGGAASPRRGGCMLVLRRMNRILEINEETMTATVEPGVTWSKLIFETSKMKLEPLPLGGGPYSGSLVGNFALGGGSSGSIDHNEVVSVDVVLPSGEILRTGSAGHMDLEEINPYCRTAWGPNLTELFRGSVGMYGIVTKLIRRLYPIRNIEENVQVALPDMKSCVNSMREIINLGICKQVIGLDRGQAALVAADPETTSNPEEYGKLEESLPAFLLCARISCHNEEQASVYRNLIQEATSNDGGTFIQFMGSTKKNLDELFKGSSRAAIHYLRHNPQLMALAYVPPSMIPGARELALKILDELDFQMTSFSGKVAGPRIYIAPHERTECFFIENDIEFDPMDPVSTEKMRKFTRRFFDEVTKYGSAQTGSAFLRTFEPRMLPAYTKLLRDIKVNLDPNGILAPAQVFKDI